jgi:hypothetical protein
MAYLGNDLQVAYQSYQIIDDISSSFNGVLTTFPLQVGGAAPIPFPINPQQCLISVNGVIQEPDPSGASGFNLVGSNIVFSSAPTGGHAFFGVILAGADYVNVGVNYPSGSESAPSITFDTDLDTGIYNPAANELGFSTNSVQRLKIESDGDINIDSGGVFYDATNNRLGIGITSPGVLLDLGTSTPILRFSDTDITGYHQIQSSNANFIINSDPSNADANSSISFNVDGSEKARIDSSGRLLVGTSSSFGFDNELQVKGGAAAIYRDDASTPSVSANLNLHRSRGGGLVSNDDALGAINFFGDDGTDIGSFGAKISAEVDGTPGANDMPGRLVFSTTADGASSPTERMRITSGGDILFGTTDVPNGTSIYGAAFEDTSSNRQILKTATSVTTSGSLVAFYNPNGLVGTISVGGSSTAFNTSSDYRLKENVIPVTDGITRLQQLKPSRFNFISDPDTTVDGFIAHEVQTIVPEAITGEKDEVDDEGNPEYQGIDQSKLVPLLTAALQEAVAKIESLEARLTAAGL